MVEQDLIKLYSQRILALAADIPLAERLQKYDGTAQVRSPLCGSTVTVDVCVSDEKISAFGQDVKACALGQAASSVVGTVAIGLGLDEFIIARDQLSEMLKNSGPIPDAPFEGLEVLLPARDYKNRHASILLCLDATIAAIQKAKA